MTQFASLDEMLKTWRKNGFARGDVELWAVSWPWMDSEAASFGQGSEASCLIDESDDEKSAFNLMEAEKDDLFVIDREGIIDTKVNLAYDPIVVENNQEELDRIVRGLLE